MPKTLAVYRPGRSFPALSVTGTRCALRCEHCGGRFLRGMTAAERPEALLEEARKARAAGAEGVLISGGCDEDGTVPLVPFAGAIAALRAEGLLVNLHPGLVDEEEARQLAATGAEAVSFDLVQDGEAIRSALHLDAVPADYEAALRALLAAGARVAPHVLVGLQSEEGERRCLELLSRLPVAAVVVLAMVPPPGRRPLPGLADRLVSFVGRATALPCPVLLGCMRPRGWEGTEIRCVQAGAAGIVNPAPGTVAWARSAGYEVAESARCCALHR